ncbi:hypothetical protein AB0H83_19485 [Dactylosporangium sp. NPDC050688]|uniref:hypothetical protein n=1 Tax=Dactylosporangium sp. NPDC050688 TaxID=3157217 RepID=UPI0033DC5D17
MDDGDAHGPDEDQLSADDFVPADGGTWHGLLFANPVVGLPPQLTWSFTFPFRDVVRDDDEAALALTVEWLPVPATGWRHLAGHHVTCDSFAEPAEASVYHYVHHRFDRIDLRLAEQDGHRLRAVATVAGDIDRLGVDPVRADAWLTFAGILVQLPQVRDPGVALDRLAGHTDTTGLTFSPGHPGAALRFVAAAD